MPIEFWYNDGGVERKAREVWYNDGGAEVRLREVWYNDGGFELKVFGGGAVVQNMGALYVFGSNVSPSSAFAQVTYTPTGVLALTGTNESYPQEKWFDPPGPGAGEGLWLKATRVAGTSSGFTGVLDTWLSLTQARSFSLVTSSPRPSGAFRATTLGIEISDSSTGINVLGSGSVQLEVLLEI